MKDIIMLKLPRPRAAAIMVLGSYLLPGCAAPPPPAPPAAPKTAFSINTPLDDLTNDPGCKAVLFRDVPGVMNSPKYPLFDDMSLAQIAIISNGRLTRAQLEQVQADFDKLPAGR